ncbi:hypothetical protein BH11PSE12_BH11PSE12_10280 [soil metagenome]
MTTTTLATSITKAAFSKEDGEIVIDANGHKVKPHA